MTLLYIYLMAMFMLLLVDDDITLHILDGNVLVAVDLLNVVDDVPACLVLLLALDASKLPTHRVHVLVQREVLFKLFQRFSVLVSLWGGIEEQVEFWSICFTKPRVLFYTRVLLAVELGASSLVTKSSIWEVGGQPGHVVELEAGGVPLSSV